MTVQTLRRVGRNVRDLDAAANFYREVLGFVPTGPVTEDSLLADALGTERLRLLRMRLGAREIEFSQCFPSSAAYPAERHTNDLVFQHIAIVTDDLGAAASHALAQGIEAISRGGPVTLPVSSGGVTAFKFRDPDGHPLEFLQFPAGTAPVAAGYDHSAIVVSNIAQSVAFYQQLGLTLGARQVNRGPAQDALDGLQNVTVDVVALHPPVPAPHVELLGYHAPQPQRAERCAPADIAAGRLIFATRNSGLQLLRDPDGHVIVLDGRG